MKMKLKLAECPTCGGKNVRTMKKDYVQILPEYQFTVPKLEFQECADCGEQIFTGDAIRKIVSHNPRKPEMPAMAHRERKSNAAVKVVESPAQYGAIKVANRKPRH